MSVSVRFVYDDHLVLATGEKIWLDDFGRFGASLDIASPISLPYLERALARYADEFGAREVELWLSDEPEDRFDDETSLGLPYQVVYRDGSLRFEVDVWFENPPPSDELLTQGLRDLLARNGAFLEETSDATDLVSTGYLRRFVMRPRLARRRLADLSLLAEETINLAAVIGRGGLDRSTTHSLLRSGLWQLFPGQDERGWLEVKSQHYADSARGEVDFASDVAAFCNAGGGVLLVGMKTKRYPDGDRITSVNGCPLSPKIRRRYRELLRRLVFPVPEGVWIHLYRRVEGEDHGVLVIDIPEQPDRLKPFLSVGGILGEKVHGALVGVPTRREADTDWLTPAALHARLRAGRFALGE